ncbi:MAG: ATP-binding protein [Actinomycetota bacterium]
MSVRTTRAVAVAIWIASVLVVTASIPIGIAARDRIEPGMIVVVGDPSAPRMADVRAELERERAQGGTLDSTTGGYNPVFAVLVVLLLLWLGVGVLILWRQPGNWAGWLFLITGAPFPLLTLMQALVLYGVKADPGAIPLVGLWAAIGEYALYPIALLPLLLLLYPDGHPPTPRWRWAVIGLVGGTLISILGFLFRPGPFNNWIEDGILYENPLGIDALAAIGPLVILVGTVIALLSAVSTVIAVRQRFKRATGEERQQMRWLAFVASLAGFFFAMQWILGILGFFFDDDAPVFEIFFGLTAFTIVVGVPAAYLVAIFRHGLWDLDVVVKKTIQYAVLVVGFSAAVGLILVAAPVLLVGIGGGLESLPTIVVGALLAVGFALIRNRARRWANRIVYGRRSTPYEVMSEFADRVGDTYSVEDVLPRMAQLLGEATGAHSTRVWLRIGDELRPEVVWPADVPGVAARRLDDGVLPDLGEAAFEVRHQGELLGALSISPAQDDPMNPTKERLARDLAAQAGLVLRNVALIEDVRESRRRIVAAQDERARALERNIHDGAQQQLVALAVKLRLAEGLVERDPDSARRLLAELGSETNATLEDLRDLARGIYPPLLADAGLAAALEAQARRAPIPVTIAPDGVGRYGQDIESAVYFCCLEALNNIAKYAHASTVEIRLSESDGVLRFDVVDDGRGFDPSATGQGTGLQGMADRLDAVGGALDVHSEPGSGTTVSGQLPVAGTER